MDNNSFNATQPGVATPNYAYNPNGQSIPGPQPNQPSIPQPLQPNQPLQPGQPLPPTQPAVKSSPILTVLTVLFGLGTVIFVVLFIWMAARYASVSGDVDKQIKDATAKAVDENTARLEADFDEREKTPNRTFAGPADYGEVTFEYPKTWSVYEYASASNGGDFGAVFFPYVVTGTDDNTINALRFTIDNNSYDEVISDLQEDITEGTIEHDLRTVNGANVNFYKGELREGIYGAMVVIKIRDKTAILQTDAYSVYENDFETILKSVHFNA